MRIAYQQCAAKWGQDNRWLDPMAGWESKYGIYEYDTGSGKLVEVTIRDRPMLGTLEVSLNRFRDPHFDLTNMFDTVSNTDWSCVQEGGFRDHQNYDRWNWSAIDWLIDLTSHQVEFEQTEERVTIKPSMDRYCLNIAGTNVHYEVTHSKVLGNSFNIQRILNLMRTTNRIDPRRQTTIFRDMCLDQNRTLTMDAMRLMVGAVK